MKSRSIAFILATGCILIGLSATATTPPEATSSAAPSASMSSSALAPKKRSPPLEPLASQAIPKEPSARPTLEEWQQATPIRLSRMAPDAVMCRAYRVREWLKIKCDLLIATIRQHGGNPESVFFWIGDGYDFSSWDKTNGGEVMFPMRPGDQRVIELFRIFPEQCFGQQALPWLIVDEIWVEGDTNPTVVLR